MSEINRIAMVNNWIAAIDAFRAAQKSAIAKPATQSERLASADTWESLFQVTSEAVEVRDSKSLEREKSDRLARRAGVATSTGNRVSIRVDKDGGFATFGTRVDPLTGAVTCGNIAVYQRTTKAHAERELSFGRAVYADESGHYIRFNVRGTWGVTGKGEVKVWNDESGAWETAQPSPQTLMAAEQANWKVMVG